MPTPARIDRDQLLADLAAAAPSGEFLSGLALLMIKMASEAELEQLIAALPEDARLGLERARARRQADAEADAETDELFAFVKGA